VTLLAVERVKLFSTRSPWWCIGLAAAIAIGFSALFTALSGTEDFPVTVGVTQIGYGFAAQVLLILAILAITTEYRFNTIKISFAAMPNRTSVLLAKTTLVALVCGVLGECTAFGAYAVGTLIKPNADLAIDTGAEWRYVAGIGVVYAITAVLGIAIGALVRQTAAAISIVLVYSLLFENLIGLIPRAGDGIQKLLPFINANNFLTSGNGVNSGENTSLDMHWGPWGSLVYFAAVSAAMLVIAIVVVERRDA
jgi:ABC-2 type transport system permease protein